MYSTFLFEITVMTWKKNTVRCLHYFFMTTINQVCNIYYKEIILVTESHRMSI